MIELEPVYTIALGQYLSLSIHKIRMPSRPNYRKGLGREENNKTYNEWHSKIMEVLSKDSDVCENEYGKNYIVNLVQPLFHKKITNDSKELLREYIDVNGSEPILLTISYISNTNDFKLSPLLKQNVEYEAAKVLLSLK